MLIRDVPRMKRLTLTPVPANYGQMHDHLTRHHAVVAVSGKVSEAALREYHQQMHDAENNDHKHFGG